MFVCHCHLVPELAVILAHADKPASYCDRTMITVVELWSLLVRQSYLHSERVPIRCNSVIRAVLLLSLYTYSLWVEDRHFASASRAHLFLHHPSVPAYATESVIVQQPWVAVHILQPEGNLSNTEFCRHNWNSCENSVTCLWTSE